MPHEEQTPGAVAAREGRGCLLGGERFELNPTSTRSQATQHQSTTVGWVTVRLDQDFYAVSSRDENLGLHSSVESTGRTMIEARSL